MSSPVHTDVLGVCSVPRRGGKIASVKVVEKWVSADVAIDHAVAVEILVVSASMMGASSSAIGSVCM